MNIIGLSAYFHDSACALVVDGEVVSAAPEERFSRFKNDPRLPIRAFRYCLETAGLSICDIDCVAYYENPYEKLSRQLAAQWDASDIDLGALDASKPFREIREVLGFEGQIKSYDHHQSHAAAAYCFSGFSKAAILTSDGVGEWATSTFAAAEDGNINFLAQVDYPHSLGLLYSTITHYLGFKVLSGEYKVMGLAPYGEPVYLDKLHQLAEAKDFSFQLNMTYFDFTHHKRMFTDELIALLGFPPREPESELGKVHYDLAKSLQVYLEHVLLGQARHLRQEVDSPNLCLSGGVALNCVGVHAIRKSGLFEELFLPPSPGDSGAALGAAALAHIDLTGERHTTERLSKAYFGPKYEPQDISMFLDALGLQREDYSGNSDAYYDAIVDRLLDGKVVAFFQGRMEFGPRALGCRSILADPRNKDMRETLNARVKKRESFRPFAPAILEEHLSDYFDIDAACDFMSETCQVKPGNDLPSITHVDDSCRPQTVSKTSNPRFYALIKRFHQRTGCPVLINTSFNVRGEPMVCSIIDAVRCFGHSGIDVLVLEDFIVDRENLTPRFMEMATHDHDYIKQPKDLFSRRATEAVYTFI